jgi:ribosomal protein L11 methyltransferase
MGSSRLAVVRVKAAEAELAADALWCRGATAIEERGGPAGEVELVAELATLGSLDDLPWPVEVIELDDSWWDGWRPFARAVRAGSHLVVQPPWAPQLAAGEGDLVVLIDPGRAFGSGSHPSTLLALAALERLVGPGSTVLDVGCGSGVLSVAAARLGAGRVVAIDIDPAAHDATLDNAARNGVAVEMSASPLGEVAGRFDVVVANMLAPTLIELAAPLAERVGEHGSLVVSGLLPQQAERVFAALAPLAVVEESELDGWIAATLSG